MRYAKRIGQGALALLLLPVVLLGLALAGLHFVEPARRYLGDQLIALANDSMDWKLKLEGYQRLNPWGVKVEHVEVYDDFGRLIVDAHGVDATIDLWQLLNQTVDIGSARVDRALLALPMVTEPDPPKKKSEPEEPEDDSPSGWRVKIPRASVGDCQLDMKLPIGELRANATDVDGEFLWHDSFDIVVRKAQLRGDLDGKRALRATLTGSDWSSDEGGEIRIEGTLVDAPLRGSARLEGMEISTPWPQGTLALHAKRVSPRTLAVFGLDPDWLANRTDLTVEVQGDKQAFRGHVELGKGKQQVVADGRWDKQALHVSARVPKLRAESLSAQLPAGTLAGHLDLRYALGADGVIQANWQQLIVADVVIPNGRLQGKRKGSLLTFQNLTLDGYAKNLVADGQVDMNSKVTRAHAKLHGFDLARLKVVRGEPLQGVVDGEVQLAIQPGGALRLQSQLTAQRVQLRSVRAERVALNVNGEGTLQAPELDARLAIEKLVAPRVPADQLVLAGSWHAGKGRARLEAKGKVLDTRLELLGERREQRLTVHGKGQVKHDGDELKLTLQLEHQPGNLTLHTQVSGDGKLSAKMMQTERGIIVDLGADDMDLSPLLALASLKERAEVDGKLHAEIPVRRDALSLVDARVRAEMSVTVPIAPLVAMGAPTLASLTGDIQAQVRAAGTLQKPQLNLHALAKVQLPERQEKPEQLEISLAVSPESSTATIVLFDMDGKLITVDGELGEPVHELLEQLRGGDRMPPFALVAQLEPRRLDLMQGVTAYLAGVYAFDVPFKLAGRITLQGKESQLSGDAALRVRVFGDAIDQSCMAGAFTDLDVSAELQRGDVKIKATGYGDNGGKLALELATGFRFARDAPLALDPATLQIEAQKVALHTLPGLCGLTGGDASGTLRAEGLGSAEPKADAELTVVDLAAGKAPPLAVKLRATLAKARLRADGDVQSEGKAAARLSFELPLVRGEATPALDLDAPARASVKLTQLPVSPFLSIGEQLGRPRGRIDGQLHGSGSLRDPKLDGYLELERVGLSIASIAQPLRDVHGRIEIHGRKLSIRGLRARDGDGELKVDGLAQLSRDWSGDLKLEVSADRFPIRRQGEVVGELTTTTGFTGKLNSQLDLTGEVHIREGRFWLTGDSGSSVQPLDKHVEIRFVDAQGKADEERQVAEQEEEKRAPTRSLSLTQLHLVTDKDIWFQHSDFSVQLGIDMKLLQENGDEKLVGEVRITRGQLELIGKPFDIERGSVRLTGDYPPDPELELKASFEPPAGQKLFVEVHGRASSPIVSFSGAATTAEEAVAIVSGLGTPQAGAEQRAQSDARGFATNITAGLLSATARRRLGDWVPLISVQSDITGAPAQARAGFDASKLIPPFLRPIARGAYVEGIVGNTRQKRSGAVGLGVRLEVALPRDFVSSMGYGPGPTWATDLSWIP